MMDIIHKSFSSAILDFVWIGVVFFVIVSFILWLILPFLLLSIRSELKKINQILQKYFDKNNP